MNYKLVDRIIEINKGKKIVCEKTTTMSEDYFGEDFPKGFSFPNSLILEAMASSASWLAFATKNFEVLSLLSMIEKANFSIPITPGECITLEVELISCQENAARFCAKAFVRNVKVAEAWIVLFLFTLEQTGNLRSIFSFWIQKGIETYNSLIRWGKR